MLENILNYNFLGNSVKEYVFSLIVLLLVLTFLKIFKKVIVKKLEKLAQKTKNDIDDILIKLINSISWSFYFLVSLFFAIKFIRLPEIINKILLYFIIVISAYYIVKGIQKIIDYGFEKISKRMEKETEGKFDSSLADLLKKITKGALWGVAILIVLQNFGYNISALLAGFGIGGIAIAFALQNVLGDIFASFSIYLDKPFQVGDYVVIGDESGTVKKIGIKSTRIETLQGEELVVSNKELTESKIHNYKRMEKRRIAFNFGVVYEIPTEKLKKVTKLIENIFKEVKLADLDRVHFKNFGDYSLNFETVYYLNSSDYGIFMDTQQEINFKIKESFKKEGIDMAYPTQTINLKK